MAVAGAVSYALIHGGGMTGRFWDRLVPMFDRPTLAVDLPGRRDVPGDLPTLAVDDEVDAAVGQVAAAGLTGPIVVVAHSSGGLVVPGLVAALDGAVAHIVLNAASVPPEGGCGLDCMKRSHRGLVESARESGDPEAMLTPGPPDEPERYRSAYGPPLDDEDLAFVVDPERCVVDTMSHYFQPVSWAGVASVPVTYVVNVEDRPVPLDLQREMAARLPRQATIVELECGHIPAVTAPEALAAVISRVAI